MSTEYLRKRIESLVNTFLLSAQKRRSKSLGEKFTTAKKEEYIKKNQYLIKLCVDNILLENPDPYELEDMVDSETEINAQIRKYLCGDDY